MGYCEFSPWGNKSVIVEFDCDNCDHRVISEEIGIPTPNYMAEKASDSYNDNDGGAVCEECFLAVFDNDSVFMSLEFSGKRVNGEMLMKYHNGKLYTGKLSGLVKGDTLICNYDFKIDGINKWYRNPIALLNDSGKLIMGIGKIKIAWGSGIFDESIPIDYENARFIFEKTICPNH